MLRKKPFPSTGSGCILNIAASGFGILRFSASTWLRTKLGEDLVALLNHVDDAATGLRLDIDTDGAEGQFTLEGAAGNGGRGGEAADMLDGQARGAACCRPTGVGCEPRSAARIRQETRLSAGTQVSCIRLSAAAEAVLQARPPDRSLPPRAVRHPAQVRLKISSALRTP